MFSTPLKNIQVKLDHFPRWRSRWTIRNMWGFTAQKSLLPKQNKQFGAKFQYTQWRLTDWTGNCFHPQTWEVIIGSPRPHHQFDLVGTAEISLKKKTASPKSPDLLYKDFKKTTTTEQWRALIAVASCRRELEIACDSGNPSVFPKSRGSFYSPFEVFPKTIVINGVK